MVKKGDGEIINNIMLWSSYMFKWVVYKEYRNCDLGVIRYSVGSKCFFISSFGLKMNRYFMDWNNVEIF